MKEEDCQAPGHTETQMCPKAKAEGSIHLTLSVSQKHCELKLISI